jgi:hypothetical protein
MNLPNQVRSHCRRLGNVVLIVRRAKLGISLLAIAMGLTLVPALTASAAVETSAICKSYNTFVKQQSKATAGLAKEMASGKWSAIQKALLTEFSRDAGAEKDLSTFLSSAPAKVKAAANVFLGQENKIKSIVEHSTSVEQYATAIEKVEVAPKEATAAEVLDNYAAKTLKCGTS